MYWFLEVTAGSSVIAGEAKQSMRLEKTKMDRFVAEFIIGRIRATVGSSQ
jgi:hypothetical protein